MMVVTRLEGEGITIDTSDGPIYVTLVEVRGRHRARIGVDAPQVCSVLRDEIIARRRAEAEGAGEQLP